MVKLSNMMVHAAKKVDIHLSTRKQIHTAETARYIFSELERVGLGLEYFNGHEPVNRPFTPDAATELWIKGKTYTREAGTHTGNTFLGRHSKPNASLHVSWMSSQDFDCISNVTIDMYKGPFLKKQGELVELFKRLIEEFSPAHAYIGSWAGFLRHGGAVWAAIPGVYWLNYFGKEYVDFIGRDHIMNCGWVRAEPFGEGVLAWLAPSVDMPDDVLVHAENLYRQRLGAQYFTQPGTRYAEAIPPELEKIKIRIVGKDPKPIPNEVIKKLVEEQLKKNRT